MADGTDDTTATDPTTTTAAADQATTEAGVEETVTPAAAGDAEPARTSEYADEDGANGESDDQDDADPADADDLDEPDNAEDGDEDDGSDDGDDDGDDDENPLDVEGEVAADYLEELLDIADLDGDIDTYVENGRAHVSVITDSEVLVGQDGEVLEALQELARLAVITETGNRSRLMLDIGGYRDRRRKALGDLAADAVEEAKASGEPVRLKPMNPFERKIVHDVVAAAGLTSESEGEEPQRRVVILPGA